MILLNIDSNANSESKQYDIRVIDWLTNFN